jgi:hypothetical protein
MKTSWFLAMILVCVCGLFGVGCGDEDNIQSIGPADDIPQQPSTTVVQDDNDNDNDGNNDSDEEEYYSDNFDPDTQGDEELPDYSDQGYEYGEYIYDDTGYDLYLYYADGTLYDHIRVNYGSEEESIERGLSGPNKATMNPRMIHKVIFD